MPRAHTVIYFNISSLGKISPKSDKSYSFGVCAEYVIKAFDYHVYLLLLLWLTVAAAIAVALFSKPFD